MKLFSILCILLLSIILVGCATSQEEPTIQLDDEQDETVYMPAGIPSNIPMFPGSELTQAKETLGETSNDYTITLSAQASVEDINTWYREAMQINDWNIKSDKTVAGYTIIQAENENLYTSMQATKAKKPETTTISQQIKIRK